MALKGFWLEHGKWQTVQCTEGVLNLQSKKNKSAHHMSPRWSARAGFGFIGWKICPGFRLADFRLAGFRLANFRLADFRLGTDQNTPKSC